MGVVMILKKIILGERSNEKLRGMTRSFYQSYMREEEIDKMQKARSDPPRYFLTHLKSVGFFTHQCHNL
jgi:hypothetical protein